ncbi:MAG: hypothetical protein ACYC8T_28905 [Myxococcaceae bacterium]
MRWLALIFLPLLACASQQHAAAPQKLYFAVELRHDGQVVGKPKLLGETGGKILVERRAPGAASADYQLSLAPSDDGHGSFGLDLDVKLPGARGHSKLELLHGEERKLELGQRPGDLQVTLLLMRVDSTEFRALMNLAAPPHERAGSI